MNDIRFSLYKFYTFYTWLINVRHQHTIASLSALF